MTRLLLAVLLLPLASGFTVIRPSFLTPVRDSTTRLYDIDVDAVTRAVTIPGEAPSPAPAPAPAAPKSEAVTVSIPEEERLSAAPAPEPAAPKALVSEAAVPEPAAPEPVVATPEPAAVAEPEPVVTKPAPEEAKVASIPAVQAEAPALPPLPEIPIPAMAGGILAAFAVGTFMMRGDKDAREEAQEAEASADAPSTVAIVEEAKAAAPVVVDGVDISVPYDAAALLAYDAWRAEHNKGAFEASKFEKFKANYESVTSANMAAKKKARDAGSSEVQLVALDASADE